MMLLTRIPAGRVDDDPPDLVRARWAFPFIGGLVGLLIWCAYAVAVALGAPAMVAALLALASLAMLTGGLHFDGLADYADGIGGGRDKAHTLDIMRDSRTGSNGVLALILVTALWVVCVAEVNPGPLAFVGAAVLSRAGMIVLQEILSPARVDGLGRRASGRNAPARAIVIALAAVALFVWPLALITCAAMICFIGWQAQRKIGGQTGDVLGAAQLISETAIWVTLALL
ncbi:MAG: adenosylcobinamide-GDP ribazoletransferase [Candidatus Phaeomarinobacter sp.]